MLSTVLTSKLPTVFIHSQDHNVELIAEGTIEPYRLDHHQVHFTEAYDGI
ncbi:MAG: hypothetical protein NT163_12205 [Chlorobiales bacterium]|nr:hypothetical protein [Chlorobiales bacterium]